MDLKAGSSKLVGLRVSDHIGPLLRANAENGVDIHASSFRLTN